VEAVAFLLVVVGVGGFDLVCTRFFVAAGIGYAPAKIVSTALGLVLNFAGRRFLVFPEKSNPEWKPQSHR
jgi:dolichol-phosphate mannosyltransferase